MRKNITAVIGFGVIILLMGGIGGLYPSNPLTVVYATSEGVNPSINPPVPPYAYSKGGVLFVDVSPENPFYPGYGDGLGVNGTFVFDHVFTIENNRSQTGYDEICVRVTSNAPPNVGLFTGGFGGNWSDAVEVTLAANESTSVGVRIDTHNLTLGDYSDEITIEAWGRSCG